MFQVLKLLMFPVAQRNGLDSALLKGRREERAACTKGRLGEEVSKSAKAR